MSARDPNWILVWRGGLDSDIGPPRWMWWTTWSPDKSTCS